MHFSDILINIYNTNWIELVYCQSKHMGIKIRDQIVSIQYITIWHVIILLEQT